MTQWTYQDEVVPDQTIPEEKCKEILAENDKFMVIIPPPEATARIRVLEREFVLDHADCLRGHPMHLAMAPDEWADFSGVPVNEADAHKSIYNLLKKGSETQALICCVEKSTRCIRGYINLSYLNEQIMHLNHIKVQRELQRHGIASLMLEGAMCLARRRGWAFNQIDLKVSLWNHRAMSFYNTVGFIQQSKRAKRPRSALAEWVTMSKEIG